MSATIRKAQHIAEGKGYKLNADELGGAEVSYSLANAHTGELLDDGIIKRTKLAGLVEGLEDTGAEWDEKHGAVTDEDIEAELAAEAEEQAALVAQDSAVTHVEAVPGLSEASVEFAQEKLERVKAIAPQPEEGPVPPAQETVQPEEPKDFRAILEEAKAKRLYVKLTYKDRQNVRTVRHVIVQGYKPETWWFGNCHTRRKENERRFLYQYRNFGFVHPTGYKRTECADEQEVRKLAITLANRTFRYDNVIDVELTDIAVPPRAEGAPTWVVPSDDVAAKNGRVWECANPRNLLESGHWEVV